MVELDMESLVLELQRAAYDHQESPSVLLSKAYTLARKLKIENFSKWAEIELNGYRNEMEIPDYRLVYGEIKAFNPYHGYIPAYFQTEIEQMINKREIRSPLAEIESLAKKGQEGGMLTFKFPSTQQRMLMQLMEVEFEVSLFIPVTFFEKVLDKIRHIILEWTLKLEEEGVYGEGMTFSKQEKEKAVTPSITNFIGTMVNSQLQQNTEGSTQKLHVEDFKIEKLNSLISNLHKLQEEVTDPVIKEELAAEVQVLQSQANSPNPKKGIIRETLLSVKNIAQGVTGSLIATGIQDEVAQILTTLPI